jgi:hypothetical protein
MNMKHLLAVLALTVAASAAHAGEGTFGKVDTDSSGTISKEEAAALPALTEQWANLDSNMDGALDEAEFAKFELEGASGE